MSISWSVSRIKSYQSCKLQYDLNYNQGVKTNLESGDAIKGTAFHAIAEHYKDHLDYSFDDWWKFLQSYTHYGKGLSLRLISKDELNTAFENLKVFWKEFVIDGSFESVIPEQKIEFTLDKNSFQGIVDLTLIKNGRYSVLDYKTTKSGGAGSEHALQLSTYVEAVRQKYEPKTPMKEFISKIDVYVYYPYTKFKNSTLENLKVVKLNFSDADQSVDTLLDAVDAIQTEKTWTATVGFHCTYCGFAGTNFCPASQVKGLHRTRGIKFFKKGVEIFEPGS